MYPTILNVVVNDVIRQWVTVVVPTEDGAEGPGETIQELVDYFYAYDGVVASTRPERLKRKFSVLKDLYNHVDLHKNLR